MPDGFALVLLDDRSQRIPETKFSAVTHSRPTPEFSSTFFFKLIVHFALWVYSSVAFPTYALQSFFGLRSKSDKEIGVEQ